MKILYKNKYWKLNEEYDIDKILYLLIDRPTYISYDSDFIWFNKKEYWHRDYDLPACICTNENVVFKKHANFHRKNNKPAVIWYNGRKEYYINNILLKKKELK